MVLLSTSMGTEIPIGKLIKKIISFSYLTCLQVDVPGNEQHIV